MTVGNQDLLYRVEDYIATITLNRPQRLNAMSSGMTQGLYDGLVAAQEDDEVRVIILTGAGRAFCSGADLKRLAGEDREADGGRNYRPGNGSSRSYQAFATLFLDKPLIAMVNGVAVGGGFDIASFADMRILSDQARVAENHVRLGLLSGPGGYWPLTRLVGTAKAMEMVLTGRFYTAPELKDMGWANYVVPHDELEGFTYAFARDIAEGAAPTSVRLAKRLIRGALDQDLVGFLQEVGLALAICRTTEDSKEGARAFVENRRKPRFTGR